MHRNNRRKGVSTVLAAVFLMIIIVVGLNAMSYGLSLQNNFAQVLTEKNVNQVERLNERIELLDVKIISNKFSITIGNSGSLPAKLVRLWVTDDTANSHSKYEIDHLINPKQVISDVGQELSLVAQNTHSYTIKAVTERGSAISFRTVSVSEANLRLALTVVPPTIVAGEDVSIIMYVFNDQTAIQAVHNIIPSLATSTPNCDNNDPSKPDCPTVVWKSGPSPSSVESLPAGSTATFKWIYNISGPYTVAGATVRFTGTLGTQTISDDLIITQITISQSNFATQSGTLTINYESLEWLQSGCSSPDTGWQKGWRIPLQSGGGWTVFRIKVTNHDPDNDIRIDKRTGFFITSVTDANKNVFYIVKDSPHDCASNSKPSKYNYDSSNPPNGDTVVLPKNAGSEVTLIFGSANPGDDATTAVGPARVYAGNIIMLGKMTTSLLDYGQNIPFMGFEII